MRVPPSGPGLPTGRLIKYLSLLWLAGVAMRVTVLAVPPVIPLIHGDLRMTEAQVGLLIGLPLAVFALAAVPGSLLVARLGATLTLTIGMAATGLAAAGRGGAPNVVLLYAATIAMGFGIAIMQPALPTLVREWVPHRIGLATAVSTNGIVTGVALGPATTVPFVLPLVGHSWRLDFLVGALPVLVTSVLFYALAPRDHDTRAGVDVARDHSRVYPKSAFSNAQGGRRAWWPDWKDPLIWVLGLTFGCNNSTYYGVNAFLPDYLASLGRADLTGAALGGLNGAQVVASLLLLALAERLHHRTWPFLVFGPAALAGVLGIVLASGNWISIAATLVGFATAITFVVTLALPPYLSAPDDVHRTSAGMFTISFSLAVLMPTLSGGLWDITGLPWTAFLPAALCAVTLTVLGVAVSRYRPKSRSVDR
jgi:MFS transporter, CP family, cyanate transporter